MFSARLPWSHPENPLSRLLREKRRAGDEILDLTESNPTRAGIPYPQDSILSALADPRAMRYEPSSQGLLSARQAVSEYYGGAIAPSQILLTASTSEAYSYLFHLLANPGDAILTPRPSYPLFEFLAGLASVAIKQYPLRYDGTWHIDFDELEQAITGRTRAIVVVNPNNPTGSFLKPDEADRLEFLAVKHALAIISDEVFADYRLPGFTEGVRTLSANRRVLTFCMSGLSKVAGLPQLKLGWIVCTGPDSDGALAGLDLISDTFLSVGTPVQLALPALLSKSIETQIAITARTVENFSVLSRSCRDSRANVLRAEGGWYAVLQVPRVLTEEQWTLKLLSEQHALVQPGYFFDFESEAFLVLSLLTPPDTFAEGVRRLVGVL